MFSCDSSGDHTVRKPGHTWGRNKVYLQCGFSCDHSRFLTQRRTLHTWSRSKESFLCVSFGVLSGYQSRRKPGHTEDRSMVSLQCGFSCGSSSILTPRMTLDTWCRKRRHSTVSPLVFLQAIRVRESLVTLGTGIGFFSGVDYHVSIQVR